MMSFLPLDFAGSCRHAARMHTEILLFDGFDELDAIGPWEVLAGAAQRTRSSVQLVALDCAREVTGAGGAVIRTHAPLSERPDVVIVPGGGWFDRSERGVWAEVQRGEVPSAIAARKRAGSVLASVCTGALLLAAAGVLDGRRATTNPGAYDDLRAHPGIDVVEARLVDDGDVLTAGAPSCGLDLGLRLVEREHGAEAALVAARELQLDGIAAAAGQ
jgi:transcriptional regulator GlxA family with amidase domain